MLNLAFLSFNLHIVGLAPLPLFGLAAAIGSCPAHPRTRGKRVPFSMGLLGRLKAVEWEEWDEEEEEE